MAAVFVCESPDWLPQNGKNAGLKNKYLLEEISERLRLFYVALTRAREKMILVVEFSKDELAYKVNGVIDNETRNSYRSFQDMLNSIYDYLKPYLKSFHDQIYLIN